MILQLCTLKEYLWQKKIYTLFGGGGVAESCSNGKGSSIIVNTALYYAWPENKNVANIGTWRSRATDVYSNDFPSVYREAGSTANDNNLYYWTDCGKFVTFIMIKSGVDKNYNPTRGNTYAHVDYIKSHPELYESITSTSGGVPSEDQLRAGDILVFRGASGSTIGHAAIYYKEGTLINASAGDITPQVKKYVSWMLKAMNDAGPGDWVVGRIKND